MMLGKPSIHPLMCMLISFDHKRETLLLNLEEITGINGPYKGAVTTQLDVIHF